MTSNHINTYSMHKCVTSPFYVGAEKKQREATH